MTRLHELKIYTEYYNDVAHGPKRFELRKNDRNYKVGDTLLLREWRPGSTGGTGEYTGRVSRVKVTYMIEGPKFGLEAGFCIMSFKMLPPLGDFL